MSRSMKAVTAGFPVCCGILIAMTIIMMTTVVQVQGRENRLIGSITSNSLKQPSSLLLRHIPSFMVKEKNINNNAVENIFRYYNMKENGNVDKQVEPNTNSIEMSQQAHSSLLQSIMKLSGGGDDDEDVTDDEESDSDDDKDDGSFDYVAVIEKAVDLTRTKIIPVVMTYSMKGAILVKQASISFYHVMQRAIRAGFVVDDDDVEESDNDDEDDDDDDDDQDNIWPLDQDEVILVTVMNKIIKIGKKTMSTIQRMVKAAIVIPEDDDITVMNKIIKIGKKTMSTIQRMVKAAIVIPEDDEEDDDEEGNNDESDEVDDNEEDKNDLSAFEDVDEEKEDVVVESNEEEEDSDATNTVFDNFDVEGRKDVNANDNEEEEEETTNNDDKVDDFGTYLAKNYYVEDRRTTSEAGLPILGGSLQNALQTARQKARMLIVFIPSEKPKSESWFGGGKTKYNDQIAIKSILSGEVAKAANKKARKKVEADLGSFVIWGCKSGSSEAISAIKRLKIKATSTTGEKRPILCVVYPAQDGFPPKILAQHHCNPPLKAESMASWINALRKRHGKQYQDMQKAYKELQYDLERKKGYIDSVQSDNERKLKEAKEEAERKKRELKEAARQAGIDARRQELHDSLPEDVKNGDNVKKIALRFADGRSGQRGFASNITLNVVFNWVDAMFEMERERVVLTTLNGKQIFSWNDEDLENTTLEDAGLKKMTAFRVSETTGDESKEK